MTLFDKFREAQAFRRLSDEALHAIALRELESGLRRDGLWAQALVDSKNESDALRKYIRLRVQALRDEQTLTRGFATRMLEEDDRKIADRDADGTKRRGTVGIARPYKKSTWDKIKQRSNTILRCPMCAQKLRVPAEKILEIRCARCGHHFKTST